MNPDQMTVEQTSDYVVKTLRSSLQSFIGEKITYETEMKIKSKVQTDLINSVAAGVIKNFDFTYNPTTQFLALKIFPVVPLSWVKIGFDMNFDLEEPQMIDQNPEAEFFGE